MASNRELQLEIHPLDETHHIGTIRIEEDNVPSEIETVIILDRAYAMGVEVRRFVNRIIPMVLSMLLYDESQNIHLITIATTAYVYPSTANGFKSLNVCKSLVMTAHFAPAVKELHDLIRTFDASKPIRVLTISNRDIDDRPESDEAVKVLVEYLKCRHFSINSQAVRLHASSYQPDTKALCSLLQINNTTPSQLVDIRKEETDDSIATTIAELFKFDNFFKCKRFSLPEQIILKFPWDSQPTTEFMLLPGKTNVFWLKMIPSRAVVGNIPVKVIHREQMTLTKFQDLMEVTLVYVLDHVKLLKVFDTAEANNSVNSILDYFETTEDKLVKGSSGGGEKQISIALAEMANDENFRNLYPEQMAEYIRELSKKHKDAADQRKKDKEDAEEAAEEKRREVEKPEKLKAETLQKDAEEAVATLAEEKCQQDEEARTYEEEKGRKDSEEKRKNQEAEAQHLEKGGESIFRKYICPVLKAHFNFIFAIIFVLFAIVEFKLQTQAGTENCKF